MRPLRVVVVLLGWAVLVGPWPVPEEASGTGSSFGRPGWAGGTLLDRGETVGGGALPFVFFLHDGSRSVGDAAVVWTGVGVPRPLREVAVGGDPERRREAVLLASAASPDVLPEAERQALATTGRYERPGSGNDTWLPSKVQEVCAGEGDAGMDLDGMPCGVHGRGLTSDEVLRSAAVLSWASPFPSIGAEGVGFMEAGEDLRLIHSMCGVRNDEVAPCLLPADRNVDGTVSALAGRPAGVGRWTLAEALLWLREQFFLWNDRAFLRAAADACRPVVLVLMGDFDYKAASVLPEVLRVLTDLRGPWTEGKVPETLLRAVLVHTGEPSVLGGILDYLQGRGFDWVRAVHVSDLWQDPLGVVLEVPARLGVGCIDRAWTVERPWGIPGLADRTDLVGMWVGTVGRIGVRPWVEPGETNVLRDDQDRDKVRWSVGPADWRGRPTYVSYPRGGDMVVVKVTDGNEATVAGEIAPLLGLAPDVVRGLLRFHRGDPTQEVDAGGAWRNRCDPWRGSCVGHAEVLGPVLSSEQVVRAWRVTSGLSDFILLFPPSMGERSAWGLEAEGRVYVGTSQGVTVYRLKAQAGSAPEEAWHFVPWQVLRHLALSAMPTVIPIRGMYLQGFQVGDRRYLVVERSGHLTVMDVSRLASSGGGLHPDAPVVVFDSLAPGLPAGVGSGAVQRGVARPVFVARPRGQGLDLEVVTTDRVMGQVCVLQYPVSRRPTPGDVVRVCLPAPSADLEWVGYTSGAAGYDVWLVFGAAWWYGGDGPADLPSVLIHWSAADRRVLGAWALRMYFEWRDPVDGGVRTGLRGLLPYRILVLPDEVILIGGLGLRSRAPHGWALSLWLPLLREEYPWRGAAPVAVDVQPESERFYMASVSAADRSDPEGFRIRHDGWTNRPWDRFCLRGGAPAMCVGWAYILRDLFVTDVFRSLGPPDWAVVPVVLRPWDCGDGERYLAWLPWPWLRSPVPSHRDDPLMKLGLEIRMFRPPAPEGYLGHRISETTLSGGVLMQTAWRRPRPDDPLWGVPRWVWVGPGGQVVEEPVLWARGKYSPNVRAWRDQRAGQPRPAGR